MEFNKKLDMHPVAVTYFSDFKFLLFQAMLDIHCLIIEGVW
jgi:hypothetical protein